MNASLSRRRTDPGTSPVPPPPVRVLVVDDDADYLRLLDSVIRRNGCLVETAVDGEEALRKLAAGGLDLLFSDLEMPRMNGLELIGRIRETPQLAALYAVMLTAHDELESKMASLARGFDDFLSKGCTEVEIVAKIAAARRLLARQKERESELETWRDLACHDELTRVASRRSFFEEARRCLSDARDVGVVLFDLDHFKRINDTYGHLAGDLILRDVGSLFLGTTRQTDLIARFGGDEFVLLMIDVCADDVARAAARIASDIARLNWSFDGQPLTITTTCGSVHSSHLDAPTVELLIETADRDLYATKSAKKGPSFGTVGSYLHVGVEPEHGQESVPTVSLFVDRDAALQPRAADNDEG